MKKRGLSTLVLTVILLSLSLAAVVIVFAVFRNIIQSNTEQVSLGRVAINLKLEKLKVNNDGSVSITVKREAGNGELTGINFLVSDGINKKVVSKDASLGELEIQTFTLSLSDLSSVGTIKDVSLVPISSGQKKQNDAGTGSQVQKCSDNTPYSQCSLTKPKYCQNGNLIDKASLCGCPYQYYAVGDSCNLVTVSQLKLKVFMLNNVKTCIVGDGGSSCTIGGKNFANNANLKAIKPSDPALGTYALSSCVKFQLSQGEISAIQSEVEEFESIVNHETNGALIVDSEFITLSGDMEMARYGNCGFWPASWNIENLADSYIDRNTDFVMVIYNINSDKGSVNMGAGGLSFGSNAGINGAGYSAVPTFWLTTSQGLSEAVLHEWLHQVYYALHYVSGINDVYYTVSGCGGSSNIPSCSTSVNPFSYFPDPDTCQNDPDFQDCGQGSCISGPFNFYKHMLEEHYNPTWDFIGNHCRNSKKDCGETGVDCGGRCGAC